MSRRLVNIADQMEIQRRTPIVTVEIQLWPQPPRGAKPQWWGNHTLCFHDAEGREVWRRDFPENESTSRSVWVAEDSSYGWIIYFVYSHARAIPVLDKLGLLDVAGKTRIAESTKGEEA